MKKNKDKLDINVDHIYGGDKTNGSISIYKVNTPDDYPHIKLIGNKPYPWRQATLDEFCSH